MIILCHDGVFGTDGVLQQCIVDETQTDRRRVVGLVVVQGDSVNLVSFTVVVELRRHHIAVRVLVSTGPHHLQ